MEVVAVTTAVTAVAADGGREQTAVDVEELELRVDALSKGLAAARESIDELKDDLEAERQERRLDPADHEAGR